MRKSKMLFWLPIIIFLVNVFFKGFFVTRFPSSLAWDELKPIPQLTGVLKTNLVYLRWFNVIVASLTSTLFFYLVRKELKNIIAALLVSLVFTFSPWGFVLARTINFYWLIIFATALLFFLLNKKSATLLSLLLILAYLFFSKNLEIPTSFNSLNFYWDTILQTLGFRALFLSGDFSSEIMRIPKAGFFLLVDLLALAFGLVFYFREFKKHCLFVNGWLLTGLVWFCFSKKTLLIADKSIFLFCGLSLIIGFGYWQIQNSWLRIAKISLVAVYLALLIFYQEMFYFHFAKKNSFFWSYGEAAFFNHIKTEPQIKNIWLSAQSEKLQQYGHLVKYPNYSFQPLRSDLKGDQLENICRDSINICVFKPDEIKEWHIISKKDTIIYYDTDAIAYVIVKY